MNFKPYNSYKYSGIEWIGEIPEHWSAKKLKHVTDIIMGQSPNSSDINNEQKGLLFIGDNSANKYTLCKEMLISLIYIQILQNIVLLLKKLVELMIS